MAGDAVIGALRVVLGADTADLEKGLKSATGGLQSFAASAGKIGAAVGAAFLAVGTAVGAAVKGAISEADDLGKMAQKIGIPVEELSRLKHAADLSDVSMEGLSTSVGKLSKNMVEVAGGATNDASQSFKALGISVTNTDGSLKSSSAVITELAGKFAGMEDGAGKTTLAMNLFGKSGKDMIPLLNSGADGLKEMMTEADQLGIVIDSKTAKSAEAFNDNLTRLGKVKDGIITQVTARMLPAFQNLSQVLIDAAKNSGVMDLAAKALTVTLQGVVSVGVIIGAVFKAVGESLWAVSGAIASIAAGKFSEAFERLKGGVTDVGETIKGTAAILNTIWVGAAEKNAADAPALSDKIAAPIIQASDKAAKAGKAIESFFTSTEKNIAKVNADAAATGSAAGAKERLRIVMEGLAIAQANHTILTEAQRLKLTELSLAAEQATLKLQGSQLVQQNLAPGEAFRLEMQNNKLALEAFGASSEQVARVQESTAERYSATWNQAGESIAGSFKDIGNSFSDESKSMAAVAKVAGVIQGTISMFTGAAKALELPFPANLAAMATVLAKGAALVASIKSTKTSGFATGGAFRVGGSGGIDSELVQFKATPGEQVDVWRPDQGGGADPRRGSGESNTVNLSMGIATTREALRDVIEGLNDMFADGYRLKIAAA